MVVEHKDRLCNDDKVLKGFITYPGDKAGASGGCEVV